MAFGVTPQGFNRKRLSDIKTEIETSLRDKLGRFLNLLAESVFGQFIGIFAEREASLWELDEAVYDSFDPSSATGVSLDRIAAFTGTKRKIPSKSAVLEFGQIFFGDVGTPIPIGTQIAVGGNPTAKFETLQAVVLVAGSDAQQKLTFSADAATGSYRFNFDNKFITIAAADNAAAIQAKLDAVYFDEEDDNAPVIQVAGSQTAATGLTFTFIVDNARGYGKRPLPLFVINNSTLQSSAPAAITFTVVDLVPGVVQGSCNAQALENGPTVANARTLTDILTPVSGLNDTMNLEDAVVGQAVEEDSELRQRREEEIARSGSATPNAILADMLSINDVTAAVVFFNKLDIPDLDGRPPHSVDIVVQGADEDEIAQAIFDTVGGGITFVGDIQKTVIDDQGFPQTIKFSRPTEVEIWVELDITIDSQRFPVDGSDQLRAAILAYAAELGVGDDIIVHGSDPSVEGALGVVPGVVDIVIRIGKTVSPTLDANIEIEPREIAEFDSSRIAVTLL